MILQVTPSLSRANLGFSAHARDLALTHGSLKRKQSVSVLWKQLSESVPKAPSVGLSIRMPVRALVPKGSFCKVVQGLIFEQVPFWTP